jgi:hypothetical protein
MRFKALPADPLSLQLLAIEADRYLDRANPSRQASRRLRREFNAGPPSPVAFGEAEEDCPQTSDFAMNWAVYKLDQVAQFESLQRSFIINSPSTVILWDYVDWPFEWVQTEGRSSKGAPSSFLAAFRDWIESLSVAVEKGGLASGEPFPRLVEDLLGEIREGGGQVERESPRLGSFVICSARGLAKALGFSPRSRFMEWACDKQYISKYEKAGGKYKIWLHPGLSNADAVRKKLQAAP